MTNTTRPPKRCKYLPAAPLKTLTVLITLTLLPLLASTSNAQLFSPARSLRTPLTPRQGPGVAAASEQAGTLQGNERFLRDNRSRADFVGNNRRSLDGFVGLEQAIGVGQIRTAIETLREFQDRSQVVNQPLTPLARQAMYYPKLTVAFTVPQPATDQKTLELQTRLDRLVQVAEGHAIEVVVEDRRAILRGVVESEEMSARAEILLGFEPGIDAVTNELRIAPETDPKSIEDR